MACCRPLRLPLLAGLVLGIASADSHAQLTPGDPIPMTLQVKTSTVNEGFGTRLSGAGDVDGDGHADYIVGAPQLFQCVALNPLANKGVDLTYALQVDVP